LSLVIILLQFAFVDSANFDHLLEFNAKSSILSIANHFSLIFAKFFIALRMNSQLLFQIFHAFFASIINFSKALISLASIFPAYLARYFQYFSGFINSHHSNSFTISSPTHIVAIYSA
jgi:hypothetical protein